MKHCVRFTILSLLLLSGAFQMMNAQIVKGEAFAGLSLSQVDGDECYGYRRFKGQIGAGALVPVTDWMDIGLEILYNPKGALRNDTLDQDSGHFNGLYDLKLNYAEVPLMIYLTDKQRYTIGIGAAYGRLVGFSEKINGIETQTFVGDGKLRWKEGFEGEDLGFIRSDEDLELPQFQDADSTLKIMNSNTYKRHDISLCADIRVRVWKGLHLQLRYQYSLIPIRTRLFEVYDPYLDYHVRLQYNNQVALRLTYIFNEDLSKLNKLIQKEEKQQRTR